MAKITEETRKKIIEELYSGKISQKDIAKMFGVSSAMVSVLKEKYVGKPDDFQTLIKKGSNYKIRVTHYVKGSLKNKFIKDCLEKGFKEAKMAGHIFETYYFIQDSIHNFDKIEPNKIKDYLKVRIKL